MVTTLVENKKAQLVVITHEVDPIERVFFLHALCRKLRLLYCIIKRKAILGSWSTPAFTQVNQESKGVPAKLVEAIRTTCKDRYEEIHINGEATSWVKNL
ncbi:60S ribosomal protein L7a [Microtus ochrogaster]|uniref:60S ribosomal protein L7a n=1 Tax=Microtus ochrogaster TaxID=79684 RepID=A0A8J6KRE8_MICOH|nr:60S ribosomal protein L7a [Microtus ochrogaster]